MKWRLVITGEGPALNGQPNDADKQAADVIGLFDGQKILAATFQVDSNNVNLLRQEQLAKKKASAIEIPKPPSTTEPAI